MVRKFFVNVVRMVTQSPDPHAGQPDDKALSVVGSELALQSDATLNESVPSFDSKKAKNQLHQLEQEKTNNSVGCVSENFSAMNLESDNILSSISATQFGEHLDGYWFAPFRKRLYSETGVKKWYAAKLTAPSEVDAGFALANLDSRTAQWDGWSLSAKQLLLVAHPRKTVAARVGLPAKGIYRVVAEFSSVPPSSRVSVALNINGKTLWQDEIGNVASHSVYAAYLSVPDDSVVDFLINSLQEEQLEYRAAGLRFAIFQCNPQTGAVQFRCDDQSFSFSTAEALRCTIESPFVPTEMDKIPVDISSRVDIFDRNWTLNKNYLSSLFHKDTASIVNDVVQRVGEPSVKYAICMIPRSGSTLLGELLGATHKLGYPIEYFVPDIIRSLTLPFSGLFSSYEELIETGFSTENGVFGIEIEGVRFFEERVLFANLSEWRVVYLIRHNVLAQAISLAISERSGVWHSFDKTDKPSQFLIDDASIKWQINYLLENERAFEKLFTDEGVEPLRLVYEDLVKNPAGQVEAIAAHVGVMDIDASTIDISKAVLKPTRTGINRYYELMMIMTGGDFWGYRFHTVGDRCVAVLTGVRIDLLRLDLDRAPVLFVADDHDSLRARIEAYIMNRLAELSA